MRYENNSLLREYLDRGAAGDHRQHLRSTSFDLDDGAFAAALSEVRTQHPYLTDEEAGARTAFRLLTSSPPGAIPTNGQCNNAGLRAVETTIAVQSEWSTAFAWTQQIAPAAWKCLKLAWAIALLLLAAKAARCEPPPDGLRAVRNAFGLPSPQQAGGLILQFQNGGTPLATRPSGLVVIDCETNMTCSWSGNKFTLTSSGGGGSSATFQANGTNTSGQTLINWQSGTNITVSNPSAGNVAFNLSGQVAVANGGTGAATTSANTVFGNCAGSSGAPSFCAITTAMLPFALPVSIANGGTAATSFTTGQPVVKGTSALQSTPVSIDATTQSGSDMCAKIASAWSTLSGISSSGGIVDARGFSGSQNCAGSMFTNYPDNSSFNGLLLLAPNVQIVTAVTQHISAGAIVDGGSGHPQYGPSPVPNSGAVIQPANGFSASTPLIEYGNSADAASVPQGQRLRNMAISCLPPSGTYITGSIGILDDYGEENSGGDGLFIDSCKIAIDIEGANAINSGPWNDTIVHFDGVTEAGALCVRYGTTASGGVTGPNRGFHGMSCDGETATTEITTGFQIDDSNISLDNINIEAISTGIEIAANHTVYGVTISNIHCLGTGSYPMTTCIDASSAHTASFTAMNINAPTSNVTNVIVDNGVSGATILQTAQQSVSFYSRDFKNGQTFTTASAFNGVCATLDQSCFSVDEEFLSTSANVTGTNSVAVPFSYPWIFLFNCGTSTGQTWGDSNANATFPNLGQARLVGCTTAASGDQILAGMAYGTGGVAGFGALGSSANWEARWNVAIDGTTNETFRVGFCHPGSAANNTCQGSSTSSIAVRYDTSQSDAGFLGETCDGTACSTTSTAICSVSTNFTTFRIRSTTAGTILFSCNGGAEQSVTTHVPAATMSPVLWHDTLSATQHTIKADFFKFRAWGLSR